MKLSTGQKNFVRDFLGLNPEDSKNFLKNSEYQNRFSGATVKVSIAEKKALDFIFKLEMAMETGNFTAVHPNLKSTNAIQKFDMARMTVLAIDSRTYMEILD